MADEGGDPVKHDEDDDEGGDPVECDGGHGGLGQRRRRRWTRTVTQWSVTAAMVVTDEAAGGRNDE
uniref:DUF834 domain-containing protein n=1 Tax=Oryza glumipatula TaxID=40148 RepID=A0A0D9YC82_9ORYZ